MNKKSLKAARHVIFELNQNGKDKLGITAMSSVVSNFLSEFPYFAQNVKEKGEKKRGSHIKYSKFGFLFYPVCP